jgi:hypothetical protein
LLISEKLPYLRRKKRNNKSEIIIYSTAMFN